MTLLAKIHIAKKQLGLHEDDYRDVLERITGKRSSKDMTEKERCHVLEEFQRLGFQEQGPATRMAGPYGKKLQALWIDGYNLACINNRDDKALIVFIEGQTGLSHPRFLIETRDAKKAIEALKSWLSREGGVDWVAFKDPRHAVLMAIFFRLTACAAFATSSGLLHESDIIRWAQNEGYAKPLNLTNYSRRDWIKVTNKAGAKLRAALAKESAPK